MKKTILVGGCSHSAPYFVRRPQTWPALLRHKYDCKVIQKVSPGAGNLFIIDHLMWELNKTEVDLVIFQITEQFRTVLGLNHEELVRSDHENFQVLQNCQESIQNHAKQCLRQMGFLVRA